MRSGIRAVLAAVGLTGPRCRHGRRANPYVVGAPVLDEALFCGRDQLLASLLVVVRHTSVLLHGEPRIGKTSILHHLKHRLGAIHDPQYAFLPVLVDLQGQNEGRLFATLAEEVQTELAVRLPRLAHQQEQRAAGYGHRELAADLQEAIATLSRRRHKQGRLVLLIDEADELVAFHPSVSAGLREVLAESSQERVIAVASGVDVARRWHDPASPWCGLFANVEVGPLAAAAAGELVRRPVRGALRLAPGVVERVCELAGCKPYPIQRLCAGLVDRAHEERRRKITVVDVEAVWARLE